MIHQEIFDLIVKGHKIFSAHRCSCGWEGDSPTVHILDVANMHLSQT